MRPLSGRGDADRRGSLSLLSLLSPLLLLLSLVFRRNLRWRGNTFRSFCFIMLCNLCAAIYRPNTYHRRNAPARGYPTGFPPGSIHTGPGCPAFPSSFPVSSSTRRESRSRARNGDPGRSETGEGPRNGPPGIQDRDMIPSCPGLDSGKKNSGPSWERRVSARGASYTHKGELWQRTKLVGNNILSVNCIRLVDFSVVFLFVAVLVYLSRAAQPYHTRKISGIVNINYGVFFFLIFYTHNHSR